MVNEVAPGVVGAIDVDAVVRRVDVQAIVDTIDIEGIVGRIDVEQLVGKVDIQALVDELDIDVVLSRVDVARLVARIDVDEVLTRIDLNAALARVEINALLGAADVDALVARIDLGALLARVDLDEVLAKVDVNALLQRVDLDALVERTELGSIIARSGSAVVTHVVDVGRGHGVAIDGAVNRFVDWLLRRDPSGRPTGPPSLVAASTSEVAVMTPDLAAVDGHYAGIVTRGGGFLVDVAMIAATFAIGGRLLEYLLGLLLGHPVAFSDSSSAEAGAALGGWSFLVLAIPLAAGGRTIGMSVVGLRAVRADGGPLGAGRAVLRTLVLPLSFALLGVGFLLIVLRGDRRALHDLLAGSAVVYATQPHDLRWSPGSSDADPHPVSGTTTHRGVAARHPAATQPRSTA